MIDQNLKSSLEASYNKQAGNRNQINIEEWKLIERENFHSFLIKEKKVTLLEIGAGPGKDSLFFKQMGLKTMSIDLSSESVKLCREKGLDAEVMSFDQLDFPDCTFDSVWALNCLLHVPKSELPIVLKEIKRVLKPDGLFYLGVYGGENSEGIWEDDFYEPKRFFSFYKADTFKEVLSKEFNVEYFEVIPKEVIGGSLEFQSIILKKPLLKHNVDI